MIPFTVNNGVICFSFVLCKCIVKLVRFFNVYVSKDVCLNDNNIDSKNWNMVSNVNYQYICVCQESRHIGRG